MIINATIPRGIRNNNPGNIRKNNIKWQGMSLIQNDPEFVRFKHPKYGFRAMAKILKSYERRGLTTIRQIISTYAPNSENDTVAYIESVSKQLSVSPDHMLDVNEALLPLIKAIQRHENGVFFSKFYRDEIIEVGIGSI